MRSVVPQKIRRFLSAIVLAVFCVNTLAYGATPLTSFIQAPAIDGTFFRIHLPESLGSVEHQELFSSKPSPQNPELFLIQDAHGNPSAQYNIARTIQYLAERESIDTVFVEGSFENIERKNLRFIEDKDLNLKLARRLLELGELTGSEWALLNQTKRNYRLPALEDVSFYRKNFILFKRVVEREQESKDFLKTQKLSLDQRASLALDKASLQLFRHYLSLENDKKNYQTLIIELNKLSQKLLGRNMSDAGEQLEFPNLVRLLRLEGGTGKIDTKKALDEWNRIRTKYKNVNGRLLEKSLFTDAKSLTVRLELETFYHSLSPFGFQFTDFPNFSALARMKIYESELEGPELFAEIHAWLELLLSKSLSRKNDRALLREAKQFLFAQKLLSLELTRNEFETLKREKLCENLFSNQNIPASDAVQFYETALQRERIFVSKIQDELRKHKIKKAIIVTGGFHADGLRRQFHDNRYSYAIIRPAMSGTENYYKESMKLVSQGNNVKSSGLIKALLGQSVGVQTEAFGSFEPVRARFAVVEREMSALGFSLGCELRRVAEESNWAELQIAREREREKKAPLSEDEKKGIKDKLKKEDGEILELLEGFEEALTGSDDEERDADLDGGKKRARFKTKILAKERHDLRNKTVTKILDYFKQKKSSTTFDDFLTNLKQDSDFKDIFPRDDQAGIAGILESEKASLKALYDKTESVLARRKAESGMTSLSDLITGKNIPGDHGHTHPWDILNIRRQSPPDHGKGHHHGPGGHSHGPGDVHGRSLGKNDGDSSDANLSEMSREEAKEIVEALTGDLDPLVRQKTLDTTYFSTEDAMSINTQMKGHGSPHALIIGDPIRGHGLAEAMFVKAQEDEGLDLDVFKDAKILEFNTSRFLDAIAAPGQFESRVRALITALKTLYDNEKNEGGKKRVILYLDFEDFSQVALKRGFELSSLYLVFKDLLAESNISLLGVVNKEIYEKLFETEKRLKGRFYEHFLRETSEEEYRSNLISYSDSLKNRYKNLLPKGVEEIRLEEDVITQAHELTRRFIPSGSPVTKIKEIIDKIIVHKLTREKTENQALRNEEKRILDAARKLKEAVSQNDNEQIQFLEKAIDRSLGELEAITKRRDSAKQFINSISKEGFWEITEDDLVEEIARQSGVPVFFIRASSDDRIKTFVPAIQKMIIGQDKAVRAAGNAFRARSRIVQTDNRPIGVFLFVGPTGVGKTELAKAIARHMFGSEDMFNRLDMSEFMDAASATKIKGSPPGYINYDNASYFLKWVRQRPFSVVLWDEIEKAHPQIFQVLMNVMDKGEMTDNRGIKTIFKNSVVIMTSNLGFSKASEGDKHASAEVQQEIDYLNKLEEDILTWTVEQCDHAIVDFEAILAQISGVLGQAGADRKEFEWIGSVELRLMNIKASSKVREKRKFFLDKIKERKAILTASKDRTIRDLYKIWARVKYAGDEMTTDELRMNEEFVNSELRREQKLLEARAEKETLAPREKDALLQEVAAIEALLQKKSDKSISRDGLFKEKREFLVSRILSQIKERLEDSVREFFPTEIRGRFEVVVFEPLSRKDLDKIIDIQLQRLTRDSAIKKIELTPALRSKLAEEGYEVENGARPLIRVLKRRVLLPLAKKMLAGELNEGNVVYADLRKDSNGGEEIVFRIEKSEEEKRQEAAHQSALGQLREEFQRGESEKGEFSEAVVRSILSLAPETAASGESEADKSARIQNFTIHLAPLSEGELEVNININTQDAAAKIKELGSVLKNIEKQKRALDGELANERRDEAKRAIVKQIAILEKKNEIASELIEVYQKIKDGKKSDAETRKKAIQEKRQSERSEEEDNIRRLFDNLSVMALEGNIKDIHPSQEAIGEALQVFGQHERNFAFLQSPSLFHQQALTQSIALRAARGELAGLEKTRFLRLNLERLLSVINTPGYLELALKQAITAIEEDDKRKGIQTVVVIDFDQIEKQMTSQRFNPFLLGFFMRLFKRQETLKSMMTTSNENVSTEDAFDRFFTLVKARDGDRARVFENFILYLKDDVEKKNNGASAGKRIRISFEALERAVKIWEKHFAGEDATQTLQIWFDGIFNEKQNARRVLEARARTKKESLRTNLNQLIEQKRKSGNLVVTKEDLIKQAIRVALYRELAALDRALNATGEDTVISADDVTRFIAKREKERLEKAGVDLSKSYLESGRETLKLPEKIAKKVVNQPSAIEAVIAPMILAEAGLREAHQPQARVLFAGPTGVGKTRIGEVIKEETGRELLVLECNGLKDFELNRWIGAPPGYIGSNDEGELIKFIREHPNAVVIFDEIEKAHPRVMDLLLQILEEGRVTSGLGKTVLFNQAVIIATSNIGVTKEHYREIERLVREKNDADSPEFTAFMKRFDGDIRQAMRDYFRPEFLNRFDAIHVFHPLLYGVLRKVVEIFLESRLQEIIEGERLAGRIQIGAAPEDRSAVFDLVIAQCFQPELGARKLRDEGKTFFTNAVGEIIDQYSSELKSEGSTKRLVLYVEGGKIEGRLEDSPAGGGIGAPSAEKAFGVDEIFSHAAYELTSRGGEKLELRDVDEMFGFNESEVPSSSKAADPVAQAPEFSDRAVKTVSTQNDYLAANPSMDEAVSALRKAVSDEMTEAKTVRKLVKQFAEEMLRVANRENILHFSRTRDKKFLDDLYEKNPAETDALIAPVIQKMGDEKKVRLEWEITDGVLSAGVSCNSPLTRKLARVLFQKEFESEADMVGKIPQALYEPKALLMKLKKELNAETGVSSKEGKTLFWLKIKVSRSDAETLKEVRSALEAIKTSVRELEGTVFGGPALAGFGIDREIRQLSSRLKAARGKNKQELLGETDSPLPVAKKTVVTVADVLTPEDREIYEISETAFVDPAKDNPDVCVYEVHQT
ncbi:MAG: AAA family ATPase, partial [Candidatus Omnitrophica bacterium]|nr:AAA family ATPase [Candidatus Omnitrophota bacterium]